MPSPRARRQAIFLGATEPRPARPGGFPPARTPLVGQGRLVVSTVRKNADIDARYAVRRIQRAGTCQPEMSAWAHFANSTRTSPEGREVPCVDGSELARKNFTSQAWSVQPCVRPVCAVHMTAGHNALRGSGPGQNLAFDNALAHVGCPDRRIDRLCITCCSPSQPSHRAGCAPSPFPRPKECNHAGSEIRKPHHCEFGLTFPPSP